MKKILVIDDDPFFAKNLTESFSTKYEVITAKDGEEGLEKAISEKPDVILLDIMMPKMNGLDMLKKLNEENGKAKIPVFITSNMSSMKKISEGLELGICGYIVKSDETMQTIVDTVDSILSKSK